MATGKDQKITITASSGLSEDEINKMVSDAAAHEAEDKARREEVDRRNKLDSMCYQLERQISENKEKLAGTDLTKLEGLIKEGRDAVEKRDDAEVTRVLESLEKEAHALASKLYENAGAEANGSPGADSSSPPPPAGKKGDVIDAEFEESP